ncbi:hypothetical protein M409DRAFT_53188 [Zasmidium cellare ATCC 36951]|uniref:Uncharacterized protein n=1 Tax=Zasmidium cellare ATCC 36951 TaxID=1080233 RepID=A0A6A6CN13_ZASCE|nr:uncharacterized protein M409DRAFT_53188 [Zasmidium cellare ATCC 36951]KAF2168525.1 hypothetical protein M409DRAFT_53188 [Zasmidium cellare ATCC 36951]
MADDDSAAKSAKGSRFLKKSKWGKIFKEDDSGAAGRQGTFKLNEDVVDFLKPSTEKNVPKIDIAIAKRWPDAHEVRRADEASPLPQTTFTKPKRRKGLTVSFVKTVPEIIGEGGDDAADPPREISRLKAMVSRSVSDRKPGSIDFGRGPKSPPIQPAREQPPQRIQEDEDNFVPQPLRRAQTSHNEFSPPVQRKHASPPLGQPDVHKPSLGRTPTGFSDHDMDHTTPLDTPVDRLDAIMGGFDRQTETERPRSRDRPTVVTTFNDRKPEPAPASAHPENFSRKTYAGLSPKDAASPVAQKRREMSANEGMMFRRASMLIQNEDQEDDDSPPQSSHPAPSQINFQQPMYSTQQSTSSSVGTFQPETFSPPDSGLTPETAITPGGLNPFDDPKYTKRHSRETAPEQIPQSQPQSLRQTARPPRSQQPTDPYQYPPRNESREQLPASRNTSTEHRVPQISQPHPQGHQRVSSRDGNYMRTMQPPEGSLIPLRPAPPPSAPSQNMRVPSDTSSRDRSRSPGLRDRLFESATALEKLEGDRLEKPAAMFSRPNGSSTSLNMFAPSASHSRTGSRDGTSSPKMLHPTNSVSQQQPPSPRYQNPQYNQSPQNQSPRSSLLGPGRPGVSPSGPSPRPRGSPEDYFAAPRVNQSQPVKSPAAQLRQEDAERPGSSASNHSLGRPAVSPMPPEHGNPAADAAFADFAGRVAHMKGVFKLTAEKELPSDRCSPDSWLRAALWWYLKGKAGLEQMLQQRRPDDRRELLTQAHVDLAKAWWILSDPLEAYDFADEPSPQSARSGDGLESLLRRSIAAIRAHLKPLCLSMAKNHLLPPTQSLIQGQDTRIWLEYPRFTPDAAAALGGNARNSLLIDDTTPTVDPYQMMPLSDTRETFCYGRFPVEVFINTDEADTDRIVLPCIMTVLRGRREYQTSLTIASQTNLVNIRISPKQVDKRSLTWSDVSWKASAFGMSIRLPRGFDLSVRMQERDFRAVWNLSEYARKVEKSLRTEPDEKLVHEARLAELQYADSSNSSAFPADKLKACTALIFEKMGTHTDGSGMRKVHRGFRMLLITEPGHKTLSSASHEVCRGAPLFFEYLTDSTANGQTAMVIRVREENRQCRMLLVFPDGGSRQALYDVLNGLTVGPDETIVGRMTLTSLNIEPASQSEGFSQSAHPALRSLQWQKLGVTNALSDDPNSRIAKTVESENLRIVARHASGCITDRLNLGKGELFLRLPVTDTPTVQILREPQEDLTMSIDTRYSPQDVANGCGQLLQIIMQQQTIRTFTFATLADLHAFQASITGFTVRYDGLASNFGISRRRMVVPIYKKWEASNVRLQVVSQGAVVQLIAFMEDFSHADALCFQIKSTDVFESVKGDNKNKKWGVKMVDAKFTLPSEESEDKRRFINLEGLEYAEEHDDITVGFETEQDRDRFAQALPAATSVSRGITLKRRI